MHTIRASLVRRSAAVVLVAISTAAASAHGADALPAGAQADAMRTTVASVADVTDADIAASNAKIGQAYQALVAMWSDRFAKLGARFVAPGIRAYRGNVRTECGIMHANNAGYCTARNAIYFDESFLARLSGAAAGQLHTDGDMAAIGVIAHEMGHAVVVQLGADSRIPYENEAAADCLAGVFTQQSQHDGTLEAGDLDEAFFGLAAAGDPTPQLTGNRRVDERMVTRASLMGHGTRDQRLANFRTGYSRGAGACVSQLQS
jgi:predicted metalloprotease